MKTSIARLCLVAVSFAVTYPVVQAQNATWTGSVSTAWENAGNWNPSSAVPTGEAVLALAGSNDVILGSAATIERLRFNNAGTWNFSGSALTISGADIGSSVSRPLGIFGAVNVTFNNLVSFSTSAGAGLGTLDIQSAAGGSRLTFNSGISGNSAVSDFAFRTLGRVVTGTAAEVVIKSSITDIALLGWSTGNSILDIQAASSVSQQTNIDTAGAVTLRLGHADALGTGSLVMRNSGTNTMTLQATGSARSYTNAVTYNSGQGNNDVGRYVVSGDFDLTFSGTNTFSRSVDLEVAAGRRFTMGTVVGAGRNLTKTGAGTLVFSGAASVDTIVVSGGSFLVNGTLAQQDTPTFTVTDTGVLGGNGVVRRHVVFSDTGNGGGGINPGDPLVNDGIGTLTIGVAGGGSNSRNLTLADTSQLNFAIKSAVSYDQLAVFGNLTLDGVLNVTDLGLAAPADFKLLSYTGTFVNNGLILGNKPANWVAALDTTITGEIWLRVTEVSAIPEPSTVGFIVSALAFSFALTVRSRRTSRG